MKNLSIIILLLSVTMVSVLSCKKSSDVNEANEFKIDAETQKMISRLSELKGFDSTKITADAKSLYYTDLIFPKESFWSEYGSNASGTSQRHYNTSLVTAITVIRVNVYSVVPAAWKTAVIDAMNAWNGLGLTISFVGVTSATPITDGINVSMGGPSGGGGADLIAAANPPAGGYPGHYLIINNAYASLLTAAEKKNAIAHEIGHCIGFLHTDGGQGTLIYSGYPCQYTTDPSSVMSYSNHAWSGFTSCDVTAFNLIY